MVFVTSRPGLFSAAPLGSGGVRHHPDGRPFARSHGPSLPSSLAESRSLALGHSSSPTGVGLRYGRPPTSPRGFFLAGYPIELPCHPSVSRLPILRIRKTVSRGLGYSKPRQKGFSPLRPLTYWFPRIFRRSPAGLDAASPTPRSIFHPASPRGSLRPAAGAGVLTGCPSPTAVALGLGPTNPTLIGIAWESLGNRRARFSRA